MLNFLRPNCRCPTQELVTINGGPIHDLRSWVLEFNSGWNGSGYENVAVYLHTKIDARQQWDDLQLLYLLLRFVSGSKVLHLVEGKMWYVSVFYVIVLKSTQWGQVHRGSGTNSEQSNAKNTYAGKMLNTFDLLMPTLGLRRTICEGYYFCSWYTVAVIQ
jgi:hypothetical protein